MNKILKLNFIFLLLCLTACSNSNEPGDPPADAQFELVLFDGLSDQDVKQISDKLSANIDRIILDLDVSAMPKVTGKIWSDYTSFTDAMRNDIGTVYQGATGYIYNHTEFRIYFNTNNIQAAADAAVHEYAHIVSLQVNNTFSNNPRWLWEAVAIYETGEFVNPADLSFMKAGSYPTLQSLNTEYNLSDKSIYSVGYVLLEYIVENWGMKKVIELISNNGNIQTSLGINNQQFEAGWYTFLENKYLKK